MVSCLAGRIPVSGAILIFSQQLHWHGAGVRDQWWVSNPDLVGRGNCWGQMLALFICITVTCYVGCVFTLMQNFETGWGILVPWFPRLCTLRHLGSFKKYSCCTLIPRHLILNVLGCVEWVVKETLTCPVPWRSVCEAFNCDEKCSCCIRSWADRGWWEAVVPKGALSTGRICLLPVVKTGSRLGDLLTPHCMTAGLTKVTTTAQEDPGHWADAELPYG